MRMRRTLAPIALLLLGACATLPMGNVPPAPVTIGFLDGQNFALVRPMSFSIGASGRTVEVPTGFVTDYASVPRSLQWLLGKQGRYSRATVLHDYLYWSHACTRRQSDNLLWIVMAQSGVRPSQRAAIIDGVRLGGASGWQENTREQAKGLMRISPVDRFSLANRLTWRQAQAQLVRDGVKDPAMPVDNAICALGDRRAVP